MSDLQCPATLLVLGREGWPSHLPVPEERNVAVVYCPADEMGAAAKLADRLEAALRPVHDLTAPAGSPNGGAAAEPDGSHPGDPGEARHAGETPSGDEGEAPSADEGAGWSVLHRALGSIADLHRGETVVVFTPTREPGREIRIDADGWAVTALSQG